MPEGCASIRSMARWVLPVLVGPSTAVTPAPGARSWPDVDEVEKGIFSGVSFISGTVVVARSVSDEAIHSSLLHDGLLRGVYHRARYSRDLVARNDGIYGGRHLRRFCLTMRRQKVA